MICFGSRINFCCQVGVGVFGAGGSSLLEGTYLAESMVEAVDLGASQIYGPRLSFTGGWLAADFALFDEDRVI